MTVENLVKQWEMEMSHCPNPKDWKTVETEDYYIQVNGGKVLSGQEAAKLGTYNLILEHASKDLYDAESHTSESSHEVF